MGGSEKTHFPEKRSEFSVGNLPRLSIAKKETFEGNNPEPKPNGKVFVFSAGAEKKLKRKRRVSTDDFCRNQVKSQSKSKFKDTLFNYFTKPNSAGLTYFEKCHEVVMT